MTVPVKQNLYRKYRPTRFSELAGQEHISRTIQSSVASGRTSHAYMFSGPRGTGKTSSARLLAKILNCLSPVSDSAGLPDCCCQCENCRRIDSQNFMDIVEIDAASNNSVEDIRQMREKVRYRPAEGKYKIYIIDEVHMLSGSAFNAFLKTLEEPPENVIFVLATTDPQKVPATIISRCQCFDFHSVSRKTIKARLEEIVRLERETGEFPEFDAEALGMIAECAQGGFRDALSLLDQISSTAVSGKIELDQVLLMTRRLSYSILRDLSAGVFTNQPASVIKILNELFFRGYEPSTIARDFLEHLRRCMLLKIDSEANQILDLPQEQVDETLAMIRNLAPRYLVSAVTRVERAIMNLKSSFQARILLESEMIRLTLGNEIFSAEELEKRVEGLEQKLAGLKRGGVPTGRPVVKAVMPVRRHESPEPKEEETVLNQVKDVMLDFKNAVSSRSRVCSALIGPAKIGKPVNGILTIAMEQEFAVNKLKEEKNLAVLLEAAREAFGAIDKVEFKVPGKSSESNERVPEKISHREQIARIDDAARKKLLAKPAIADAIEVFGGEILDLES
ncbi:MAG: DNA polymerase III subunit gamma/tau [Candidatus Riflebacteria bacterium]